MEQWKRNVYICTLAAFITSAGMSQLAPMLPLYIRSLGVEDPGEVARWAGIVFAMNFVTLAVFSPIWGRLSDRYGRKLMCLRAVIWLGIINFGMGMAQQVWHLVVLRLLQGALSGFLATAMPLVSSESPTKHAGWALGLFFTGQISGSLIGPLLGGWLSETVGFRHTYFIVGSMCLLSSLALLGIHETYKPSSAASAKLSNRDVFSSLTRPSLLFGIFLTTFTFQFSLMCVQPILTVYIAGLVPDSEHIALISGAVFSSAGFASALFGSRLGALSDRIGAQKVLFCSLLTACLVSVPQAFVTAPWQLGILRFIHGIAVAGLMPSVNHLIKQAVPPAFLGRMYGFNQSFQFIGMSSGAVFGGYVAEGFGIPVLFFLAAAMLLASAGVCYNVIGTK
ncbi:MAG: MFS transporter [Acidaminococcaceae bacterium]|nr:MFS transporter [Acidaminococcaceae bacterium]